MSLPTMHLEAVLFAAAKPISIDMLEEVFGLSRDDIQAYINELKRELEDQHRGIRLRISCLLYTSFFAEIPIGSPKPRL